MGGRTNKKFLLKFSKMTANKLDYFEADDGQQWV